MRAVGSVVVMSAAYDYFDDARDPAYIAATTSTMTLARRPTTRPHVPRRVPRLWQTGDDRRPAPKLAPAAYHGPLGESWRMSETIRKPTRPAFGSPCSPISGSGSNDL